MTITDMQTGLATIRAHIAQTKRQLEAMELTETGIMEVLRVSGIEAMVEGMATERGRGRPRTTSVVVLAALEKIGKPATIGTVRKFCLGHRLSRPTITSTLKHLADEGQCRRVARGLYAV